ncbi:hypothetical protein FRC07_000676 [Ceratobasidium sp. 392]|nr:hypothetical protein FRC07_000676 [Ceratobasidium sp. 392]
MIILESERSDSKVPTVRSGDSATSWHEPPSPPPYSATIASSDDSYQRLHPIGTSSSPPDLPPRCNHLVERKTNQSVSGTWHVDTALIIPDRLLPPITEFDGAWNQDTQKARKAREKEMKKRERSRGTQPPLPPVLEVRPNLMLTSTNGSIKGDVHIVSSDGLTRQTIVVAQGTNGAINLTVNATPDQPLRVYAVSTNGPVTVRIPMSFEGAIMMSTTWGGVKISDGIKAKLMTFSSTSNTTRCFIGDWQAAGFGYTPQSPDPNDDPPLPTVDDATSDPFASWSGPLIRLGSTNGSLSLSFIEESVSASPGGFGRALRNLMGWFGGGGDGHDGHGGGHGPSQTPSGPPPPSSAPGSWPGDVKHPDGKIATPAEDID